MTLPPNTPDLVSLDLFCTVVELGSLGRAARRHGISQPSASSRIRNLERQLAITLLTRGPNGSEPTPAGALVAEWASGLLASADQLLAGVATLRADGGGALRIAASNTIAEFLLPRWLVELRRGASDASVEVEVTNSTLVQEQVRAGRVGLGFIESPSVVRGVSTEVVAVDSLVLVVAPGHRWSGRRRPISIDELADEPLVAREAGSGTREALSAALAVHHRASCAPVLELGSTSAVKAAVQTGDAPAVLSELAVAAELAAETLVRVEVDGLDLTRRLRAVWSGRRGPAEPPARSSRWWGARERAGTRLIWHPRPMSVPMRPENFVPGDAMNFVGGVRLEGSGPRRRDENPATSQTLVEFRDADAGDVDHAVDVARAAQPAWAAMVPVERGRVLRRAADLLRRENVSLARWEVLDTGKPIREALVTDVISGADCLEFYGGLIAGVAGEHHQLGSLTAYTRREPVGVVGAIGAWNYPLQIACWKAAPALAAGNAVVYKPSEATPITAVALGEALVAAGLPAGVFNVVQGAAATGEALSGHPGIDKLSVTGSVPTGRRVMAAASAGPRPVTLELGGKSPLIVCEDAEVDRAVTAAVLANFATQGEVCTNGTRVYVHRSLHDEFVGRFVTAASNLVVGDPLDPSTHVGSLISDAQLHKVLGAIEAGRSAGAELAFGGARLSDGAMANGRFVEPTVFCGVDDAMALARDEIFGPVASVFAYDDEDEVVARANHSEFGLAAGLVTRDLARAHRMAAALDAGLVWINTYNVTPVELPFGGVKSSGLGRENGWAGLESVTRVKTVMIESGPLRGL